MREHAIEFLQRAFFGPALIVAAERQGSSPRLTGGQHDPRGDPVRPHVLARKGSPATERTASLGHRLGHRQERQFVRPTRMAAVVL